MEAFKVLFLLALVVVFKRDWLQRQLARPLGTARVLLRRVWPDWRAPATERGYGDPYGGGGGGFGSSREEQSPQGPRGGGGGGGRRGLSGGAAPAASPYNTRGGAAAAEYAAAEAAARHAAPGKLAADVEKQWEQRTRRKGLGRKEPVRERSMLELMTERRERAARALQRHQGVRDHLRHKRDERGRGLADIARHVIARPCNSRNEGTQCVSMT
jgi:hypothetical protein